MESIGGTSGSMDNRLLLRLTEATTRAAEQSGAAGRPFCTLTYAQSVDGCITFAPLSPTALSGRESMFMTHVLRAAHDAILVGVRTVLSDDPSLTVRLARGESPQPVVVDTRLSLPLGARLLSGSRRPWIAAGPEASPERERQLVQAGAEVVRLPLGHDGLIDLPALMAELGRRGVRSLMVEGGGRVLTSFLKARLADQMVVTIAPTVLGGVRAFGRFSFEPGLVPRLVNIRWGRFGEDLVLWGRPIWRDIGLGPLSAREAH